MPTEEIINLNNEIEDLEDDYWNEKFEYEQERAKILLETDFASVLGKAKPTVSEKDAYVELQIGDKRLHYRTVRTALENKKRLFQVMLQTIGDGE